MIEETMLDSIISQQEETLSRDSNVVNASLRLDYIMGKAVDKVGGKYKVCYDAPLGCWLVYYYFTFNREPHTTLLRFDYYACMHRFLYEDILQKLYACMSHLFLDGTYEEL